MGALKVIGAELAIASEQPARDSKMEVRNQQYMQRSIMEEEEKDMYKDSVDILGVSMDELEEFMNPSLHASALDSAPRVRSSQAQSYRENAAFIQRLDQACRLPESLNGEIDQIKSYCVKLIDDLKNV